MKLINKEIRIETVNSCNARCIMCPRENLTRPAAMMSNWDFITLISEARELGANFVSVFGYGEPLIDSTLDSKLQYCTNLGIGTFITTNGSLLSPQAAISLLNAGLSKIRFSVHGIGETYNKVHRGLDFGKTMDNIGNFLELNNTKYDHACYTYVTVMPQHGETIEEIRDFWETEVDELEIWKPHNWVYGQDYREITEKRKRTCGRPHSGPVQILADGKMIVCCYDFDGKMVVGDTNKQSIEEILKGDEFERIRKKHETGDLEGLPCEICDQLNEYKESPLLYSSVDKDRKIGLTSSTKFNLEEI